MINFIVCDDFVSITEKVTLLIDKVMMKNKIAYKKHIFHDYDEQFRKVVKEELPNKIYFLDIETKSASGIEMARLIRKTDINSIIIFMTIHEDLGSILLHDELMFLTFISKFDNFNTRIDSAIKKAIKIVGEHKNIRFTDKGIIYTIPLDNILYITTITSERKTLIVTDNIRFKVGISLSDITSNLTDNFKQTHRACFINMNRTTKIDRRKKEIIFDNSEKIDLLSSKYKKEIV